MLRQTVSRGARTIARRIGEANQALSVKLRTAKKFIGSAVVAAGVTVSVLAMFVPFNIVHPTGLWHSIFGAPVSSVVTAAEPVKASTAAKVQSCDVKNTVDTALFAICPTFALDYSSIKQGSVDPSTLNIAVGHATTNNEAETYTASSRNIRIENGALVLEAHSDAAVPGRYTSAKVDTKGKQDMLYGKIIIQAQTPTGIGTWPAIWMLPSSPKYANLTSEPSKRYLNDGEIDILEAVGLQPNTVFSVAHTQAYDNNGVDHTYFNTVQVPNDNTGFQTYELDWTPTSLNFMVNGQTYFTYTKPANADYRTWPFDQPFYLIMNLALGGNWGGEDRAQFPRDGIDAGALPTSLKIKSVDYYPYIGPQ